MKRSEGVSLVEVIVALAVVGLLFGGIINSYLQTAQRAEWSGYSLAAHSLAIQQLEQARSAKWDIQDTSGAGNEITNFSHLKSWKCTGGVWTGYTNAILDLPISGTNVVWATNFVTIRTVTTSTNPLVNVQMVKVDTVWPFRTRFTTRFFTNTVANYYAPD